MICWHKQHDGSYRYHHGAARVWLKDGCWHSVAGYSDLFSERRHASLDAAKSHCEGVLGDGFIPVELAYPDGDKIRGYDIALMSVRANDGIRVAFDFDRDGWAVLQPVWSESHDIAGWREVFFAQAWAFDPTADEDA